MRVITGVARGMKLKTLEGRQVRPTTDLVKEAMFSILHFEVEGVRALDLFAGSGQLGIEALSRGAAFCVFVDSSREAQEVVKENLKATGLWKNARVAAMDAADFLRSTGDVFDLALLDPPYEQGLLDASLPALAPHMSAGGVIMCECRRKEPEPPPPVGFYLHKTYHYGQVKLITYRRVAEEG